jgi:hypothetical protein
MPVSIKGSGGGSVTLDAGAAASATTLTLPNTTGTLLHSGTAVTPAQGGTGLTSVGTAGNILTSDGTAWTSTAPAGGGLPTPSAIGQIPFSTNGSTYAATQKITQGTSQASTSGTSIDFTSIPSWVKRITVMFNGVSVSGTSIPMIRLGDSGGIEATSYNGTSGDGTSSLAMSTGFSLSHVNAAVNTWYGLATICYFGSDTWIFSFVGGQAGNLATPIAGGAKTLSATLDRIRITTVNGTDTFDAGSINILYE